MIHYCLFIMSANLLWRNSMPSLDEECGPLFNATLILLSDQGSSDIIAGVSTFWKRLKRCAAGCGILSGWKSPLLCTAQIKSRTSIDSANFCITWNSPAGVVVESLVVVEFLATKRRDNASKIQIGIPVSNLTRQWVSRSRNWRCNRLWRESILMAYFLFPAMKRETNGASDFKQKTRIRTGAGMLLITKSCPTQRSQKCTVTFLTAAAEASAGDNYNIRRLSLCLCYLLQLLACPRLFHNVQCLFYLILVVKAKDILPIQI